MLNTPGRAVLARPPGIWRNSCIYLDRYNGHTLDAKIYSRCPMVSARTTVSPLGRLSKNTKTTRCHCARIADETFRGNSLPTNCEAAPLLSITQDKTCRDKQSLPFLVEIQTSTEKRKPQQQYRLRRKPENRKPGRSTDFDGKPKTENLVEVQPSTEKLLSLLPRSHTAPTNQTTRPTPTFSPTIPIPPIPPTP